FRSSVVSHCPGHTPPLPSFPTRRSSDLDQGIPLDFIGIAFVHQIDMPPLYRIGIVAVLCNKKNVAPSIFNLHFPGFRPEVEPVDREIIILSEKTKTDRLLEHPFPVQGSIVQGSIILGTGRKKEQ